MSAPKPATIVQGVANTLRQLPLLVSSSQRMAASDPLLFAVQFSRRLPRKFRLQVERLSASLPPSLGRALLEFIADHPSKARMTLEQLGSHSPPSALEGELRTQLGLDASASPREATRVRDALARGNLLAAHHEASGSMRRRTLGQLRLHAVGTGIVLRDDTGARAEGSQANDHRLRVLHFLTNSIPWTQSGYTFRSHSILQAQSDAGIDLLAVTRLAYPTTIGRPWAAKSDTLDGVTYRRLDALRTPVGDDARLAQQAAALLKQVREFRPDVLHTTTDFTNALTVDAVARATGLPWVYEMRGNMEQTWLARQPEELREQRAQSERYIGRRARETEMALRANHVVALSELQKRDLASRGVPQEKITVIPNSVDADLMEIPRDPVAARNRLGLPQGFWVGSVTAVVDYEGLDDLLRACAILKDSGRPVHVAVVGDGVSLPALRSLVHDLNIEDFVVFPGRVPPREARDWYQALDVFVVPRKDTAVTRSVTPIKGLQAMALGIPIVASDLPALNEVTGEEAFPFAVEPGNPEHLAEALEALARNSTLLSSKSAELRRRASAQTWSSAAEKYKEIYSKVRQG